MDIYCHLEQRAPASRRGRHDQSMRGFEPESPPPSSTCDPMTLADDAPNSRSPMGPFNFLPSLSCDKHLSSPILTRPFSDVGGVRPALPDCRKFPCCTISVSARACDRRTAKRTGASRTPLRFQSLPHTRNSQGRLHWEQKTVNRAPTAHVV